MKAFRKIPALLLLAIAGLLLSACAPTRAISRIHVRDCAIKYIVPSGNHSFQGVLRVTIHNPGGEFFLDDIHGKVYDHRGQMATVSGDRVYIRAHGTGEYDVPCIVTLAHGYSYVDLMQKVATLSFDDVRIDLSARVHVGRQSQKVKYKGLRLHELTRR